SFCLSAKSVAGGRRGAWGGLNDRARTMQGGAGPIVSAVRALPNWGGSERADARRCWRTRAPSRGRFASEPALEERRLRVLRIIAEAPEAQVFARGAGLRPGHGADQCRVGAAGLVVCRE